MQLACYIISICLHLLIFLLIWFWPVPAPIKLDNPPIMISLVEGDQGGSKAPSPILGHLGEQTEEEKAPQAPAPKNEIAATERIPENLPKPTPEQNSEEPVPIKPAPQPEPVPMPEKKPEPVKEEIPVPKPDAKPEPKQPETKQPESKKPEQPKQETKKPEPKKEQPKPKPAQNKPKRDPVAEALAKARKATSRADSDTRGNAVERALAEARRNTSGTGGGGGGSGEGPGGGGLGDVYIGSVMLAVRPNWGFASSARANYVCVVKVNVDMQGKVLNAVIDRSSGNAQYDASAVNAIMRTSQAGDFPPPPNPQYTELDLVFTFNEMRAR